VGIPREKTESLLATHGNTMTANLPLLYATGQSRKPLLPGQHTLFLSFGEGISGGGLLYKH
jgi:3-oxoacyl-[acyl-carrier-protein] synthase-3